MTGWDTPVLSVRQVCARCTHGYSVLVHGFLIHLSDIDLVGSCAWFTAFEAGKQSYCHDHDVCEPSKHTCSGSLAIKLPHPDTQVVYAARDAVLTACAYRQLRAWHDATVNPIMATTMCEVQPFSLSCRSACLLLSWWYIDLHSTCAGCDV